MAERQPPDLPPVLLPMEDDGDMPSLKQPIDLGTSGVVQLIQCLQSGTDEVRHMLLKECDIILECAVCRSMYRGLPNFLAHKRVYCTDLYSDKRLSVADVGQHEMTMFLEPESPDSLANQNGVHRTDQSEEDEMSDEESQGRTQAPNPSRMLSPRQSGSRIHSPDRFKDMHINDLYSDSESYLQSHETSKDVNKQAVIELKRIDGVTTAVQQNVSQRDTVTMEHTTPPSSNKMSSSLEVPKTKLHTFIANNKSICDLKNLKCLRCDQKFQVFKSLKFHMVSKHMQKAVKDVRWKCLYCTVTLQTFNVLVRHLLNIHKMKKPKLDSMRDTLRKRCCVKQSSPEWKPGHGDTTREKKEVKNKAGESSAHKEKPGNSKGAASDKTGLHVSPSVHTTPNTDKSQGRARQTYSLTQTPNAEKCWKCYYCHKTFVMFNSMIKHLRRYHHFKNDKISKMREVYKNKCYIGPSHLVGSIYRKNMKKVKKLTSQRNSDNGVIINESKETPRKFGSAFGEITPGGTNKPKESSQSLTYMFASKESDKNRPKSDSSKIKKELDSFLKTDSIGSSSSNATEGPKAKHWRCLECRDVLHAFYTFDAVMAHMKKIHKVNKTKRGNLRDVWREKCYMAVPIIDKDDSSSKRKSEPSEGIKQENKANSIGKIEFSSGLQLHKCPECGRICGKASNLYLHLKKCKLAKPSMTNCSNSENKDKSNESDDDQHDKKGATKGKSNRFSRSTTRNGTLAESEGESKERRKFVEGRTRSGKVIEITDTDISTDEDSNDDGTEDKNDDQITDMKMEVDKNGEEENLLMANYNLRKGMGIIDKFTPEEEEQIAACIDDKSMKCMQCGQQYKDMSGLRTHAVRHLGWRRFKCKLCMFTSYYKSECRTHLRRIHPANTSGMKDVADYIIELEPEQKVDSLTRMPRVAIKAMEYKRKENGEESKDEKKKEGKQSSPSESPDKSTETQGLRTRSGLYKKPSFEFLKRKREQEEESSSSSSDSDSEDETERTRTTRQAAKKLKPNPDDRSGSKSPRHDSPVRGRSNFTERGAHNQGDQTMGPKTPDNTKKDGGLSPMSNKENALCDDEAKDDGSDSSGSGSMTLSEYVFKDKSIVVTQVKQGTSVSAGNVLAARPVSAILRNSDSPDTSPVKATAMGSTGETFQGDVVLKASQFPGYTGSKSGPIVKVLHRPNILSQSSAGESPTKVKTLSGMPTILRRAATAGSVSTAVPMSTMKGFIVKASSGTTTSVQGGAIPATAWSPTKSSVYVLPPAVSSPQPFILPKTSSPQKAAALGSQLNPIRHLRVKSPQQTASAILKTASMPRVQHVTVRDENGQPQDMVILVMNDSNRNDISGATSVPVLRAATLTTTSSTNGTTNITNITSMTNIPVLRGGVLGTCTTTAKGNVLPIASVIGTAGVVSLTNANAIRVTAPGISSSTKNKAPVVLSTAKVVTDQVATDSAASTAPAVALGQADRESNSTGVVVSKSVTGHDSAVSPKKTEVPETESGNSPASQTMASSPSVSVGDVVEPHLATGSKVVSQATAETDIKDDKQKSSDSDCDGSKMEIKTADGTVIIDKSVSGDIVVTSVDYISASTTSHGQTMEACNSPDDKLPGTGSPVTETVIFIKKDAEDDSQNVDA